MYNDFPILSNNEYEKLKEQYNSANNFSRIQPLNQICSLIHDCNNSFQLNCNQKINNKIKSELTESNSTLIKILENLKTTFTVELNNTKSITSFNLFSYLKKLMTCIRLLNNWLKYEKKEFYKSIIISTRSDIENIILNLFTQLEKINIYFFKYM